MLGLKHIFCALVQTEMIHFEIEYDFEVRNKAEIERNVDVR